MKITNILIVAGGTAGHVNPALAIAAELKRQVPNVNIHFAGCKNGMEAKLVKNAGYKFHSIEVRGIQRRLTPKNIARNFAALYYLSTSLFRANAILKEVNPVLVIGTGGYVSGPVVRAAAKKGIKTAIHEQNAFPGITNKILAQKADLVFAAVPQAVDRLSQKEKTYIVGNPIRTEFFMQNKNTARKQLAIPEDKTLIVSFGGSLGAQNINTAVANLAVWEKGQGNIKHIHATGSIEKEDFAKLAKELQIDSSQNFEIREYIDNMPLLLSAADLVISRAGALTLAEIAAVGKASILIPSPNVAENHQYHNAKQFENVGGAVVIEEKNLTDELLISTVKNLTQDKAKLEQMGSSAKVLSYPDSTEKIWQRLKVLLNMM